MSPPTVSEHDALPAGSRLGEFEIECVLGVGGFGIVYRAFDHALERRVAVKEYMPAALATRGAEHRVALRSAGHADTFQLGLRSFINEARLLARFDHPALVKVYRFWEANDTAYMVMPWYEGATLLEARRAMGQPPTQAWLRSLLDPLLGALDVLHKAQVFHRDIAPDNILLLGDASGEQGHALPVLLDFGAARRVIGDNTQTLTAIVKPSFAPIEQYAESPQLRQGPWTDIYALAAVVHYCITGRPPMPATARAVHDELPPLAGMAPALARDFGRPYSAAFLAAIDHALAVRPDERPPSVGLWRAGMEGQAAAPAEPAHVPPALERTVFVGSVHGRQDPQAYATTVPAASPLRQMLSGEMAEEMSGEAAVIDVTAPDPGPVAPRDPASGQPVAGSPRPASAATWIPTQPVPASAAAEPTSPRRLLAAVGVVAVLGLAAAWGLNSMLKRGAATQAPSAVGTAAGALPGGSTGSSAGASNGASTGAANGDSGRASATAAAPLAGTGPSTAGQGAARGRSTLSADAAAPERALAGREAARDVARSATGGTSQPAADRPAPAAQGEGSSRAIPAHAGRTPAEPPAPRREAAASPLNPRAACGDRVFIALALCMKRYCSRPEYTRHPECARMRAQEEANRQLFP